MSQTSDPSEARPIGRLRSFGRFGAGLLLILAPLLASWAGSWTFGRLHWRPSTWILLPVTLPLFIWWRYGLAITGFRLVFEGRVALEAARELHGKGLVLYLRPFDVDGQSSNTLYGAPPLKQPPRHPDALRKIAREQGKAHQTLFYGRDNSKYIASAYGWTYEQQLRAATCRIGAFVSLASPIEPDVGLGAERLDGGDGEIEWRQLALTLIAEADLVILRGGKSDELLWELAEVRQLAKPERVLLFLPSDMFGDPHDSYEELRPIMEKALGVKLPRGEHPHFIGFSSDWSAHAIRASAPFLVKALMYGAWSNTENALARALKARHLPGRQLPRLFPWLQGLLRWIGLIAIILFAGSCVRSCFRLVF